jgi:hypothetical protein
MPNATQQEREELRRLVRKHRVVYQVSPATEVVGGQRVHVGCDLDLLGAHEPHAPGVLPGCERCRTIWDDLLRIAEAVRPTDVMRATVVRVALFDHAIHTRRARQTGERDEVCLTLTLRRKSERSAATDECEERCLRGVIDGMRNLGLQPGAWQDSQAQALT